MEIEFDKLTKQEQKAVEEFLSLEVMKKDDIVEIQARDDGLGLDTSNGEFLIMTEDQAQEKAEEYIKDSVWAFNKSFLDGHSEVISKIPEDAFKVIQEKCEDSNEVIIEMIEDMDHFIEDAINTDGRGHFLSSYDGEEYSLKDGLVYIREN